MQQNLIESGKGGNPLKKVMEAMKGCRMPNLIRINHPALRAILRTIIDPYSVRSKANGPLIINAPYKPLIHYEAETRMLLNTLREAKTASSDDDAGPSDAGTRHSLSNVARPDLVSHSSEDGHQASHTKNGDPQAGPLTC
jgi:hypothetical protein